MGLTLGSICNCDNEFNQKSQSQLEQKVDDKIQNLRDLLRDEIKHIEKELKEVKDDINYLKSDCLCQVKQMLAGLNKDIEYLKFSIDDLKKRT